MGGIFLKLFNMSITASWIVLAVVILRFILKKAPKWINCLLWAIVGLRLIFPFSFESVLSLIPSAETVNTSVNEHRPIIQIGVPIVDTPVNEYLGGHYYEGVTVPAENFSNIMTVIGTIWFVGVVVMAAYGIISYLRLRRKVDVSLFFFNNIYFCDDIDSPFILGILKPKIYLPSGLSADQINYVVAHENAHLKRKDYLWKPLGFALLSVYWFNPVMWAAYILLCRDIELACDEKVIKNMDNCGKKGYSEALVSCSVQRRTVMACPLAFGEVGVKDRIKSVLNYKKPAFWVIIIAVVACIAVSVCFLTNPKNNNLQLQTTGGMISVISAGTECENVEYKCVTKAFNKEHPYIEVEWHNNNDDTVCFGTKYALYKDGKLCDFPNNYIFDLSLQMLLSNGKDREKYYLGCFDLAEGKNYKIEKKFYLESDPDTEYCAYVHFTVEKGYSFTGKTYDGENLIYECDSYPPDFIFYGDESMPQFCISSTDFHLFTNGYLDGNSLGDWYNNGYTNGNFILKPWYDAGELKKIELNQDSFDSLMTLDVWDNGYFPSILRRNNLNAFSVVDTVHNRLFYLLEQKNGDIYIAQGYIDANIICWVFKMKEIDTSVNNTVFFYENATEEHNESIIKTYYRYNSDEFSKLVGLLENQLWTDDSFTVRGFYFYDGRIYYNGEWIYFGYEQKIIFYDHYFCTASDEIIELIKNKEDKAIPYDSSFP